VKAETAATDVALPAPPPLTRRLLRLEVLAVLALSLGASAAYALVDIVRNLVVAIESHQALSSQTTTLYAPADTHPYIDLAYQLLGVATQLAPVLLVAYLLLRSRESLSTLGIDATRPVQDLAFGALLALVVGSVGLGLLLGSHAAGFSLTIAVGATRHYWWTVPLLTLQALGNGISEEVIVGAYLLHRLDQLGWSKWTALLASAVLRGAYHLYQGFGSFVGNLVLGLFFGLIFQRTRRAMPMLIAHFLVDAVAFVGYLELKGHISWLP
jgi:membrane protease YdiL (CAAX protease family)